MSLISIVKQSALRKTLSEEEKRLKEEKIITLSEEIKQAAKFIEEKHKELEYLMAA